MDATPEEGEASAGRHEAPRGGGGGCVQAHRHAARGDGGAGDAPVRGPQPRRTRPAPEGGHVGSSLMPSLGHRRDESSVPAVLRRVPHGSAGVDVSRRRPPGTLRWRILRGIQPSKRLRRRPRRTTVSREPQPTPRQADPRGAMGGEGWLGVGMGPIRLLGDFRIRRARGEGCEVGGGRAQRLLEGGTTRTEARSGPQGP
jgi:hypothetical protein